MQNLKTHYQVHTAGGADAHNQWRAEGLLLNKAKFCDGLMLSEERWLDFTKDIEGVDCKRCLKKIDIWTVNGFELPY